MHARQQQGVTLIELLVTVVIISLLAAVAVPSYQNYFRKARATAAEGCILEIAKRFETFYQQKGRYPTTLTQVSIPETAIGSAVPYPFCNDDSETEETDFLFFIDPSSLGTGVSFHLYATTSQADFNKRDALQLQHVVSEPDPSKRNQVFLILAGQESKRLR